ncbi:beta-ketoacyl synthase N-terminal-like domain-containing protein [Streptomyces sp. NPDC014733]|uniref:beta-ketoacyl synthase N-terminal-like domain-containing protein n=1 Tax=Streptomyces sp. NPDC014733 TaxID=3364885 RepID=UPI0036F9D972
MGIASEADTGAGRTAPEEADAIAVVGLSCRFPGADGPDTFWRLLHDGPEAPGASGGRRFGPGGAARWFGPESLGVPTEDLGAPDPRQRLSADLAREALESAGILPEGLAGSGTGVFLGASACPRPTVRGASGTDRTTLASRLSATLGLRGPSLVVDTARSSALTAVHLACMALRGGECDEALAGGVTVRASAGATAEEADGGLLVLKTLRRALADGDTVHCLIRGGAVSHDGGATAGPDTAQEEAARRARAHARVDAAAVRFVELAAAAGPVRTAVPAGSGGRPVREPLPADAGAQPEGAAAALLKTVLCLRAAARVTGEAAAWTGAPEGTGRAVEPLSRRGSEPVLAGVGADGDGGACHLVLSDWVGRPAPAPAAHGVRPGGAGVRRADDGPATSPAETAATLRARAARMSVHLATRPGFRPEDIADALAPTPVRRPLPPAAPGPLPAAVPQQQPDAATSATPAPDTDDTEDDASVDLAAGLNDEQVLEILGELPLQRLREEGLLSRLLELAGHR